MLFISERKLASKSVLTHNDRILPVVLACDMSQILSGEEKPIAFVPRTLTKAQPNCSS